MSSLSPNQTLEYKALRQEASFSRILVPIVWILLTVMCAVGLGILISSRDTVGIIAISIFYVVGACLMLPYLLLPGIRLKYFVRRFDSLIPCEAYLKRPRTQLFKSSNKYFICDTTIEGEPREGKTNPIFLTLPKSELYYELYTGVYVKALYDKNKNKLFIIEAVK